MYMWLYIPDVTKRYSIADARINLPAIIDQAEAGQVIELTRRGRPVAAVISLDELARLRGEQPSFSDAYARFTESHPLEDVGLDERWFDELRDRTAGRSVPL